MIRARRPAPTALPAPAASALPVQPFSVAQRLGVWVLLIDIYFVMSRLPEFIAVTFGSSGSIAIVARLLGLAAAALSGGLWYSLRSRVGVCLAVFTGWLVLASPFSTWKSGSLEMFTKSWLPSYAVFLVAGALLTKAVELRRALYTLIASSFTIILMSQFFSATTVNNRMEFVVGTLKNANDLALLLLTAVPCVMLYMALNPGRRWFMKAVLAVLVILILHMSAQTGSRGAVLNLFMMGTMAFLHASMVGKFRIFVVCLVLGVLFLSFSPSSSLARYATILPFVSTPMDQIDELLSARDSSIARRQTLAESIQLTLRNPVLGVGPGVYTAAAAKEAESRGERANWLATHNAFTQVSSEAGIPALAVYLAAIVLCFRALRRAILLTRARADLRDLYEISFCLSMLMASYVLNACFGSLAYLPLFPMLAGLTVALEAIVTRQAAMPAGQPPEGSGLPRLWVAPAFRPHPLHRPSEIRRPA